MLRRFMFAGAIALVAVGMHLAFKVHEIQIQERPGGREGGVELPPHFLFVYENGTPVPLEVDDQDRLLYRFWAGRSFSKQHALRFIRRLLRVRMISQEWSEHLQLQVHMSRTMPEDDPSTLAEAREQFDLFGWDKGDHPEKPSVALYYHGRPYTPEVATTRDDARGLVVRFLTEKILTIPEAARLLGATRAEDFYGLPADTGKPIIEIDNGLLGALVVRFHVSPGDSEPRMKT